MRTLILKIKGIALLYLMLAVACNSGSRGDRTVDSIEEMNDSMAQRTDSAVNELGDSTFAKKAADAGLTEVAVGMLAQEKSTNETIKEFGKMMVTDHTKANDELKAIAKQKNIMLPTKPGEEHAQHISMLSAKSGNDFDKSFSEMMVQDHEEVYKLFEDAATSLSDVQLKDFAAKTLPVLEKHLREAKTLPAK